MFHSDCGKNIAVEEQRQGRSVTDPFRQRRTIEKRDFMTSAAPSFRDSFAPHLPYLRRYARALTGSQKSGDNFVRASLEALAVAPGMLDQANPAGVELFRLFHAFWSPQAKAAAVELPTDAARGEIELQRLPVGRREALLLTSVEGFTVADTASILGRSVDEVEADIAAARDEIGRMLKSRVLIIEDEPLIAMHIESIVEDMGHATVGIATTHAEAVELGGATAPDLILADIQLADGSSGIDAVNELLAEFHVPVIFITAYPERLLTGERPEPTYFVTKPFEADTVAITIGQALLQHQPIIV
jgi:CheY-like chemotaxis protein